MVEVQKSEVIEYLIKGLRLSPGLDSVPKELAKQITPVFNVEPVKYNNIIRYAQIVATGNTTVYTTPTDKDFYLNYLNLTSEWDAAATPTEISIKCTPYGSAAVVIISFAVNSLNPSTDRDSVTALMNPIKLEPGSNVLLTATFGAGNLVANASIGGYTEEK